MPLPAPAKLPPGNQRRVIEEMLVLLPESAEKLKLLNRVMGPYGRIPAIYRLYPRLAEVALRKKTIDAAEQIRPGSREKARRLMASGAIPAPKPMIWRIYQFRHAILTLFLLLFGWGMGSAVAALFDRIQSTPFVAQTPDKDSSEVLPEAQQAARPAPPIAVPDKPTSQIPEDTGTAQMLPDIAALDADFPLAPMPPLKPMAAHPPREIHQQLTELGQTLKDAAFQAPDYLSVPIWLVEKKGHTEVYSNGLHIITRHAVANEPRRYLELTRNAPISAADKQTRRIAGIVFHASESDLFPFHPEMNSSLKRYSAALIKYLKQKKSYHYFIDRFGRVYRIVRESDAAYHAGNSVWADDQQFYLNLNHAFLGICFEGRDFEDQRPAPVPQGTAAPGPRMVAMRNPSINQAQLQSGKELTDWLRYTHAISEHNCVPHGLVSVNPANHLIGHHLDLAHSFPFEQFGLSNKYRELLPSIAEFGFTHDQYLNEIFNGRLWPGVYLSQRWVRQQAWHANIPLERYQLQLQSRFHTLMDQQKRWAERWDNPKKSKTESEMVNSSAAGGPDAS